MAVITFLIITTAAVTTVIKFTIAKVINRYSKQKYKSYEVDPKFQGWFLALYSVKVTNLHFLSLSRAKFSEGNGLKLTKIFYLYFISNKM